MKTWFVWVVAISFFPMTLNVFGQESINLPAILEARLSEQELSEGWIRLFDGQSLTGWKNFEKADWKVVDGALQATKGENSLLCTTVPFRNYELSIEFRADEGTNSGVFLRTPVVPTNPAKDCLELNIAPDNNPFPTGSLVYRHKRSEQVGAPKSIEWNTFRVLLDEDQVKVWLNEKETVRYQDTTNLENGLIGLQFREGAIAFRNIKLRPIGTQLLPGKRDAFKEGVKVTATYNEQGALTIVGGRGHVESTETFGDGFIQFAAMTLSPQVNSGLFFRCIPGEDMNGYECQLHHGFKENRLQPVDSGTGAIFRRQPARAVLSDEGQETFVTIVMNGPRIATWVQGIQVVDFEDTRKPDPNPRKGLRTEPGTLMLQGHDPGSKVRFDMIRVGR